MKNRSLIWVLFLAAVLLLAGCNTDNPNFKVKPSALGVMNEIVVIADDDIWEGPIGDSIRYYFAGAYPITPQPEPIFDLRHYNASALEDQPLRKELRTYLIVADLADPTSETASLVKSDLGENGLSKTISDPDFNTSVGRNKWATGQILVYLFDNGYDNLAEAIRSNFSSISAVMRNHDDIQLSQLTYSTGVNKGLSEKVAKIIGVDEIKIPSGYIVVKEYPESQSIWLRKDTRVRKVINDEFSRDQRADVGVVINLILGKQEYSSENQLSIEAMKAEFNRFGKEEVQSNEPNTFLLLNDHDLPIFEYNKEINGHYTKEYRGIWEMENDFMGGPILAYRIVSNNSLIVINSFVFAVGTEKRNFMQQVEKIVTTINKNPT